MTVRYAAEFKAKVALEARRGELTRRNRRRSAHRTYPYPLREMTIDRPNQVRCTDITCILMRRDFLYLVAVMDWSTRKVLSWLLSNTMEVNFCIEALEEAIDVFGRPAVFDSDQGSLFASPRFTEVLIAAGVRISMDGRGRWMDNVFIERLWRSLKYECVYLHAFETGSELRTGLAWRIGSYNSCQPHSGLDGQTPDEAYTAIGTDADDATRSAARRETEPSLAAPPNCPTKPSHLSSAWRPSRP
jgi:putative transposase